MTYTNLQTVTICEWCGGDAIPGSTCPRSIECPVCHSPAGSPCYRPSGHRAPRLHAPRIAAAEALDGTQAPAPLELEADAGQLDIFGGTQAPAPELPAYMAPRADGLQRGSIPRGPLAGRNSNYRREYRW